MKTNFLILIQKVHNGRFDIEFINTCDSTGSYYYSVEDNKMTKYKVFECKDIPDNTIVIVIKNRTLFYEE
jgi:hypothetical protein